MHVCVIRLLCMFAGMREKAWGQLYSKNFIPPEPVSRVCSVPLVRRAQVAAAGMGVQMHALKCTTSEAVSAPGSHSLRPIAAAHAPLLLHPTHTQPGGPGALKAAYPKLDFNSPMPTVITEGKGCLVSNLMVRITTMRLFDAPGAECFVMLLAGAAGRLTWGGLRHQQRHGTHVVLFDSTY